MLLGFAKVTRDLTARRAADAALRAAHDLAEEARTRAEEASRAKSLFLATMSHETRTPLNAIMAYTDMLEMELAGPLTADQRRQLGRIRFSSMHLLGIVDEVLEYARTEAGRTVVRRTAGRIGPAVEGALAMVSPRRPRIGASRSPTRSPATRRRCPTGATRSGCGRSCSTCCPTPSSSRRGAAASR